VRVQQFKRPEQANRMRKVVGYTLMAASMVLIVFMAFRAFFAWLVEGTGLDLLVDGLAIGAGVLAYAIGLALVTSLRRD
jgi:apolipoprotein N-acyltransferase